MYNINFSTTNNTQQNWQHQALYLVLDGDQGLVGLGVHDLQIHPDQLLALENQITCNDNVLLFHFYLASQSRDQH